MRSSCSWSSECPLWGLGVGGCPQPRAACRGVCACSIEGGELFERIVDEDYQLTEVDTMVFVRQICEGILFMHKMRVLHLDLKVLGCHLQQGSAWAPAPTPLPSVFLHPPLIYRLIVLLSNYQAPRAQR